MTKLMKRLAGTGALLVVSITVLVAAREQAAARYFPPAGDW